MMSLQLLVPNHKDVEFHVEYRIVLVVNGEEKDHVWRRFRVLDSVFKILKKKYPEIGTPPPRGYALFPMSQARVAERRDHIEAFLTTVLNHPKACCDTQFQHLVGIQQTAIHRMQTSCIALLEASYDIIKLHSCFIKLLSYKNSVSFNRNAKRGTDKEIQTIGLDDTLEDLITLQGVHKQVTERAVAAELLVSTMKFNKDCQITPSCVFLQGTPPDDRQASGSFLVESPEAFGGALNRSFLSSSMKNLAHEICVPTSKNWMPLVEKISIPKYEYKKDDNKKEILHYNIQISTLKGETWSVWRRYNAFCSFKQGLSDAGFNTISSGFPQRISLGGVDARRAALELWLESTRMSGAGSVAATNGSDVKTIEMHLTTFLSPTEDDSDYVQIDQSFDDLHQLFAPHFPGG